MATHIGTVFYFTLIYVLHLFISCHGVAPPFESENTDFHPDQVALPYVESHTLTDGTIVDCVKVEDQLTLQHPMFKDHVVQKPPAALSHPKMRSIGKTGGAPVVQLYQQEVGSCPTKTIPVQRFNKDILEREAEMRKNHPKRILNPAGTLTNFSANIQQAATRQSYAIGLLTSGPYNGAMSRISTWDIGPGTYGTDFTLSQIWVVSRLNDNVNTAEAGWHVYPLAYTGQDTKNYNIPRLFVYWTSDSYRTTGCYNLRCTGFIQTDSTYVLGGAFSGDYNGHSLLISIGKVAPNGDWWLIIENIAVGYWPNSLFTPGQLQNGLASEVQWGGEVHLSTPESVIKMGNGKYGSEGNKATCCNDIGTPAHHAIVSYLLPNADHSSLLPIEADKLKIYESDPKLYDTNHISHVKVEPFLAPGTWLFFGGPGVNQKP